MVILEPVDGTDIYLWKYLPSIPAAIIFILLFTGITSTHCWRMVKTRSWFCSAFAVGGLSRDPATGFDSFIHANRLLYSVQMIGYPARVFAHYHTDQIAPYAVQSSFILLAPVFYAASIYMVLGRLVRSVHGERFSIVRPSWMSKLFISSDVLALNVQGIGGGFTTHADTQELGKYIVIVGLFIQLVGFGFFVAAALLFHMRMRREVAKESELRPNVPWRQGLKMLYACSGLIIVRSCYRIIEYIMGLDGYLLSHEWPMYIFDAVPMWTIQVIFLVWFPDKLQPSRGDSGADGQALVEMSRGPSP
ncbi:RTA1 like protein-domain-containing protein [Lipomyces kononenkoae]